MNLDHEKISGGHFLISRLIYNSAIWKKPPQYLKLFLWIIGKANFQDGYQYKGHALKRAELITCYGDIVKALSFTFNKKIVKPSIKEIRIILNWLQSKKIISVEPLTDETPNKGRHKGRPQGVTGAYLGLKIYIINYDTYQDAERYKGRPKKCAESAQGHIEKKYIGKEYKKPPADFSFQLSELEKRYSDQEIINQTFQAIALTRKSNRITDSVKLSILQSWEKYPIESVMAGIKTYLDKGYAEQGKKEAYLLGIIKNVKPEETSMTGGQVRKSTGSHLYDRYLQGQEARSI